MTTISPQRLAAALARSGDTRLAEHVAAAPERRRLSADALVETVERYEALGQAPTAQERGALRNVLRVLSAKPLFDLVETGLDSLSSAASAGKVLPRLGQKLLGWTPFSSRAAPRVIPGGSPSGIQAPWRIELDDRIYGQPVLSQDGQQVFALSGRGRLFCRDGRSGEALWDVAPGESAAHGTPALSPSGDTVVFTTGSQSFQLHAFDTRTKELRWSTPEATGYTRHRSSPVLSPDGKTVFLGCPDHFLRAYDLATGEERWPDPPRLSFGGDLPSAPVPSPDGRVVVAASNERVHAFDAETGEERWSLARGRAPCTGSFSPDGETFYVTGGGHLRAVSVEDGSERWSAPAGNLEHSNASPLPSPDGRYVFQANRDGVLLVFDATDGRELRRMMNPVAQREFVASPAFCEANQTVYVVDAGSRFSALDVSDDDPAQWTFRKASPEDIRGAVTGGFALSSDGAWAYTGYSERPVLGLVELR